MYRKSVNVIAAILIVSPGCSGSSESTASRARKPVNQSGDGSGSGADTSDNINSNLSCNEQWTLAVKQQPVGSQFVYSGSPSLASLPSSGLSYQRTEVVTASSDSAISRRISVTSSLSLLEEALKGLGTNQFTITKEKFLDTCSKANGQPVTVSGLGGQFAFGAFRDETVTVASGRSIPSKHVDIEVTNITFGSYNVRNATVSSNVSTLFPLLPLKQRFVLKEVSNQLLNNATLDEVLQAGLPAIK